MSRDLAALRRAAFAPGAEAVDLLALADALDEAGHSEPLAYALRWCARRGRFPYVSPMGRNVAWERLSMGRRPAKATWELPPLVFDAIRPSGSPPRRTYRYVKTAIHALAHSLRRLRDAVSLD